MFCIELLPISVVCGEILHDLTCSLFRMEGKKLKIM